MITAEILTYPIEPKETVASLQCKIHGDTGIPPANQELLLEAGLALEPSNEAELGAVDYCVRNTRTHTHTHTHTHTTTYTHTHTQTQTCTYGIRVADETSEVLIKSTFSGFWLD